MFKNSFKAIVRSFGQNKTFSLINIFGLAIGIACAGLIFLWVKDELTFNDYFKNQSQIYKINNSQTYDGRTYVFNSTPGPLAAGIKDEIPGIAYAARASWSTTTPFTKGDKSINANGYYVDPSFLQIFHLHFINGNAASSLTDLKSVILTEEMAHIMFGNEDPVGQELLIGNKEPFKVTAVVEKLPENTSVKFQWLAPFKNFENNNTWLNEWGNNGVLTFIETNPKANIAAMNKQLYDYMASKGPNYNSKFSLYPMARWHLYDSFDNNGKEIDGSIKFVRLFSIIACIILFIACINFMNLSTAHSEKRAREVGVRKVLGAGESSLRLQFLFESTLMAFIAAILAVALILLVLPFFNNLVEKSLSLSVSDWTNWVAFIAIVAICGLTAGSYPSFYLSSFKPVAVLKGLKWKDGNAGFIRKGLVVIQFVVSITLIISTIIIYKQITHVKDRDLGFNRKDLIYVQMQGNMNQSIEAIRNELLQTNDVVNAGAGNDKVLMYGSNTGDFSWQGKDPNKQVLITLSAVSPTFISTVGYQLKEGRNFNVDVKSDSNNIIINETFAHLLNTKEVIGSQILGRDQPLTVVGVVRDFVYNDVYSKPAPLMFYCDPSQTHQMFIRIRPQVPIQKAVENISSVIKKMYPGYPVEPKFIDSDFNHLFQTESLIGKLAGLFSGLAIFISCLGLFGLSAFTAEKRTKEIGIRKVLGADVKKLVTLLSKDFVILVGLSCLIAFPVAWWIMHVWLNGYAYHTSISWMVFLVAGLSALVIALLTVSFQAIKAALANPVKSLRTE